MITDQHVTRGALLDAGVELLREMTPAALVAALRTRAIARRAGVSAATFFHHFRTIDEYGGALVEHVFSPTRTRLMGTVAQGLREAEQLHMPAQRAIAYHQRDLMQLAADPDFRLRLGLWAFGGSAADEAYGRMSDEVDRQLLPQAQALHDLWGREVRLPLDARSNLAIQLALLNGATMRHLSDPLVMTPERYAPAAAALSMVMLRPRGDRRTMGDRLSEMNYYSGRGAASTTYSSRQRATRGRILNAAAELFGEYGFEATSTARIARTAGIHVATLYVHFPSKARLALALFDVAAEAHFRAAEAGVNADPWTALQEHLRGISDFVSPRADLARLYLANLACGDDAAGLDDVLRQSTRARVAAVRAEAEGADRGVERPTEHLLITTIGLTLRYPGDGAEAAVAEALRCFGQ